MRRLLFGSLASLAAGTMACGLVFAPGDFTGASEAPVAADADLPEAVAPVDSAVPDAGSDPTPRARIILFAGRRDAAVGEPTSFVTETLRTTLGEDGSLSPWTYDVSPSIASTWTRATRAGSELFILGGALLKTSFTDATTGSLLGEWATLAARAPAPEPSMRPAVLGAAGVLSAGSFVDTELDGRVPTGNVWFAPLDATGYGPWEFQSTKLTVPRGDVTLERAGDVVYAFGGRSSTGGNASGRPDVEYAPIDATGHLGAFKAGPKLQKRVDGGSAEHTVFAPIVAVGAGRVFVVGGQASASATSVTDVVETARIIDPATGELEQWILLPRLPEPMSGFAALVTPRRLVVFGGLAGAKPTDAVYGLAINPDGTFGTEWTRIGSLPGPRSGVTGVTY